MCCPYKLGRFSFENCVFYRLPELEVALLSGDMLQLAAVVTDEYGRVTICPGMPYIIDDGERLTHPTYIELDPDPNHWEFE